MKKKLIQSIIALYTCIFSINAQNKQSQTDDRTYWADLMYKISEPVLSNMSKGELSKNMELELSPTWDGRDKRVTYLECFGRLLS